jgi:hypothetical protein
LSRGIGDIEQGIDDDWAKSDQDERRAGLDRRKLRKKRKKSSKQYPADQPYDSTISSIPSGHQSSLASLPDSLHKSNGKKHYGID